MCGGALSPAASKSAKVVPFASGEGFSLSASLAAVSPETARLWNRARNAGLTPGSDYESAQRSSVESSSFLKFVALSRRAWKDSLAFRA